MGDTDTPDLNKARGFLLGFSVVVFLLWYFDADLSSFKLMGNEIVLNSNTENSWFILAIFNLYFWFRYFQRLPKSAFLFDEAMNNIYDSHLAMFSILIYGQRLKKSARADQSHKYPLAKIVRFEYTSRLTCHGKLIDYRSNDPNSEVGLYSFTSKERSHIVVTTFYYATENIENLKTPEIQGAAVEKFHPNLLVIILARFFTLTRGALVSPWLTDNVFPLIVGALAIAVALIKWVQILLSLPS